MKTLIAAVLIGTALVPAAMAQTATLRPDQSRFRELYKELVEIDTSLESGSCTLAAEVIAARMKAAGLGSNEVTTFADPEHPKEGGLVAVLPGKSKALKPMLLVAHLDVVTARKADWERDPFVLREEGGYFYGRGTLDDKSHVAIWTDLLIGLAKSGQRTKRTIKMALTCGEETNDAFNGIKWLALNRRDLIDAEFAFNEGGYGSTNDQGVVTGQAIQIGEKTFANFELEARNKGGHSASPRRDNAIYQIASALRNIQRHEFPLEFTDTTRAYFRENGANRKDALGDAMVALAANPADSKAEATVNEDPWLHSNLRTTCVATTVDAGHARNALPQRARANINCRIFPRHSVEEIRQKLMAIVDDPEVSVTALPPLRPSPPPPPLDSKIMEPTRRVVAKHFPGASLVPTMANSYTDATYLGAAGIPTYGVPGFWDASGTHGLNERINVTSLYRGRDFLVDLVMTFANQ